MVLNSRCFRIAAWICCFSTALYGWMDGWILINKHISNGRSKSSLSSLYLYISIYLQARYIFYGKTPVWVDRCATRFELGKFTDATKRIQKPLYSRHFEWFWTRKWGLNWQKITFMVDFQKNLQRNWLDFMFLVGAFRINEPDYYSHSFFSFFKKMRRNFCSVCSTKRIPGKRI